MKNKFLRLIFVSFTLSFCAFANAALIFSNSGVVTNTTNTATFDSITTDGIDLNTYTEDGISVSMNDISWIGPWDFFNNGPVTGGIFYGSGGNSNWTTISMVNNSRIYALDFLLGDGWQAPPTTNLIWEVFDGVTSIGFGDMVLNENSTVGWTNGAGFTSIRVAAHYTNIDSFGQYQAIALDNVRIDTRATSVSEPLTLSIFTLGVIALMTRRFRPSL